MPALPPVVPALPPVVPVLPPAVPVYLPSARPPTPFVGPPATPFVAPRPTAPALPSSRAASDAPSDNSFRPPPPSSAKRPIEDELADLGRKVARELLAKDVARREETPTAADMDSAPDIRSALDKLPGQITAAYKAAMTLEEQRNAAWGNVSASEAAADDAMAARRVERIYIANACSGLHTEMVDSQSQAEQFKTKILVLRTEGKLEEAAALEEEVARLLRLVAMSRAQIDQLNTKLRSREIMWSRVYDAVAARNKVARDDLERIEIAMLDLLTHVAEGDLLGKKASSMLDLFARSATASLP